jgi:lysophospholipase L1-like esterase
MRGPILQRHIRPVKSAMDVTFTIVALGDSTTAGTPGFKSPIEAPPEGAGDIQSQYAYWLMQEHANWFVLNRGVNGERCDQIGARIPRDVAAAGPDAVVLVAGVNDVYHGLPSADVQRALEALYALIPVPLVVGSILPFNTATSLQNRHMHEVNAWIRRYADAHPGVFFCDTRAAVAAPGEDRLLSSSDGLHPSPEGYRSMALALEPAINQALVWAHRLL